MNKCLKHKTIDIMKQLLDYAKMLPTFMVEFDIIANGSKIENLGYTDEELRKLESISYGDLWGDNYGEIIVKNKGKNNGKKLLVYGTSFSNPIKLLLASEYETTYIIDGRYYKDKHLDEYINEQKVLITISAMA